MNLNPVFPRSVTRDNERNNAGRGYRSHSHGHC